MKIFAGLFRVAFGLSFLTGLIWLVTPNWYGFLHGLMVLALVIPSLFIFLLALGMLPEGTKLLAFPIAVAVILFGTFLLPNSAEIKRDAEKDKAYPSTRIELILKPGSSGKGLNEVEIDALRPFMKSLEDRVSNLSGYTTYRGTTPPRPLYDEAKIHTYYRNTARGLEIAAGHVIGDEWIVGFLDLMAALPRLPRLDAVPATAPATLQWRKKKRVVASLILGIPKTEESIEVGRTEVVLLPRTAEVSGCTVGMQVQFPAEERTLLLQSMDNDFAGTVDLAPHSLLRNTHYTLTSLGLLDGERFLGWITLKANHDATREGSGKTCEEQADPALMAANLFKAHAIPEQVGSVTVKKSVLFSPASEQGWIEVR